jgi:hypothetical protein
VAVDVIPKGRLTIIIDAIESEEQLGFIQGVRILAGHSRKMSSELKVLLTTRRQAIAENIVDGMLYIEYGKERHGQSTFYYVWSTTIC